VKGEAIGLGVSLLERAVLVLTAATLGMTLVSWAAMRHGAYSLPLALAAACACGVVAAWCARPRPEAARPSRGPSTAFFGVALLVVAGIGVLHASFPTYFLLGGQDPGPYLTFAARIAKTGGLDLRVPEIQAWAHAHPGLYRSFPAVYGDMGSAEPDALHPQFVHLFTSYLANAWAAFGVEGAVRANAYLGCLCLLTGFVLLWRIDSLGSAFSFVVLLGINPAFVWATRITLTETLALWLNLTGLWLLLLAWDRASSWLSVCGALVLGGGVLNRLDGGLGALALVGFSLAALLDEGKRARIAAIAAVTHLGCCVFGYVDGQRLAPGYFHDLNRLSGGDVTKLIVLTSGLDLLALGVALVPRRLRDKLALNETTLRLGTAALVVGLFVWVAFGVTLRTLGDDPETATTLLELTWYLGWAVWPLYFFGLGRTLGRERFERCLPLVLFSAGALVIYTARTDVVHEHIWASRRWVPHTIPLVLVLACMGASGLIQRISRRTVGVAAASALAVICLAQPLLFDRPFLFRSMLKGLPAAYERIATYGREHRAEGPLVTDSVQLGSILTYSYEVPTVVLNEAGAAAAARGAFAGQLGLGFDPFSLHNMSAVEARFAGPYLGRSVDEPPSEIVELRLPLEAGVFGAGAYDLTVPVTHPSLRTRATRPVPEGLAATRASGAILWGPWIDLPPGRFRAEWYGRTKPGKRKRRGTLDVIYAEGRETIAEAPLEALADDDSDRLLGQLDFALEEQIEGVEFRVRVDSSSGVTLTRLRLQHFADSEAPTVQAP